MSVESVLKRKALDVAQDVIRDPQDTARRKTAQRRVDLYLDNGESILRNEIGRIFRKPEVRARIEPFIKMAASQSLFKRIVDEIARPVYSTPPVRRVEPAEQQAPFMALATESRLNEKMDLACRLVQACNTAWLFYRVNDRLGMVVDVLTPNMVTVIPDPDDPTRELALIYDKIVRINGRNEVVRCFWDDEQTFMFNETLLLSPPLYHGLGRMPFVSIHRRERWGTYYDVTSGNDLENAQVAVSLLTALVLKLHKSQGHRQMVLSGDIAGTPKDQTLDEENALVLPDGTSIQTIDLKSDATHYVSTIAMITERVAANHGLNRERLNQNAGSQVDEAGLLERRADAIKVFRRAEQDGFEVMKLVSPQHKDPEKRLSADATLKVDFTEISDRADKMTLLGIWKEMRSMGLRSVLDDIRALNPEVEEDDQAWAEIDRNMAAEAEFIRRRRALNIPEDATQEEPGQDAKDNGAMGPAVRDGKMTRDDAAEQAAVGPDGSEPNE